MTTSKKVASDAGRILQNPKSTPREKEVAASDLRQRQPVLPQPKKGGR